MKKMLSLLFIFSLMLGIVALSACGETTVTTTQTEQVATTATGNSPMAKTDFEYSVNNDGSLMITKYIGTEKNVAMPSEIDGKAVTKIGEYVFTGCDCVESVTLPSTVNGINKKAFFNAAGLKNINVSEENARSRRSTVCCSEQKRQNCFVIRWAGRRIITRYRPASLR